MHQLQANGRTQVAHPRDNFRIQPLTPHRMPEAAPKLQAQRATIKSPGPADLKDHRLSVPNKPLPMSLLGMNHVLSEIKKRIKADRKSRESHGTRKSTLKNPSKEPRDSQPMHELVIGLDDSGVFKVTLKDEQLFKNLSDSEQKKKGSAGGKDIGSHGSVSHRFQKK